MEEKKTNSKSHPVICPKCKYNRPVALSYCPHCRTEEQKKQALNNILTTGNNHVYKASTKGENTQQKKPKATNGEKANKQPTILKAGK